jgi:hypothetical protein
MVVQLRDLRPYPDDGNGLNEGETGWSTDLGQSDSKTEGWFIDPKAF